MGWNTPRKKLPILSKLKNTAPLTSGVKCIILHYGFTLARLRKPEIGGCFMYFLEMQENNLTYSCDMLRLRTDFTLSQFSKLELRFKTCWKNLVKKCWNAFGIAEFRENYNIEVEGCQSFWFGFWHNSDSRSQNENSKYNFTIEFNPNKLKDNKIVKYILSLSREWRLRRFDFAVDIPISILDICGLDKKRYKDIRTFNAGYDNKTIYIGRSNNHIKIYNKKKESELDIRGELTRLEVTSEQDYKYNSLNYFIPNIKFPDLYTAEYMYTFKDYEDKTLLAILYAVQNGFPLNDLTRVYRQKVKKLLEGGNHIDINIKCVNKVINEVLNYYLRG